MGFGINNILNLELSGLHIECEVAALPINVEEIILKIFLNSVCLDISENHYH